jgi:ABC-type transport system involved in multi-copper enzyme maturation permease subunit
VIRSAQLLAIGRSTFTEIIRQPVYGLLVLVALAAYALSPAIAMFSLGADRSLLKDFGVSTLFITGLCLAAFAASRVVGGELENRTALILLSKPVGRGVFLVGKFLGILSAVTVASFLFTLALLLAARMGPPESAHTPVDWPVVTAACGAFFVALAAGMISSYRASPSSRPFGTVTLKAACWTLPLGFLVAGFFDRGWRPQPFAAAFDPQVPTAFDPHLVQAALLVLLGIFVLCSVAVLLSILWRRAAFFITVLVFLLGLALASGDFPLLGLVPDFHLFWVGELFYLEHPNLSLQYFALAVFYAVAYSVASLAAAAWLLQRREVG